MKFLKDIWELIEKCNEKLDRLYDRFNGTYFAFIAIAISIISISTACELYALVDASFSISTHWISNLGAISAPNGAHIAFNSGMIITSLFMLIFFHYSTRDLQKKGANKILILILFFTGLISSLGLFFVGIFPMDLASILHGIAASTYFIGTLAFSIFIGITELSTPRFPKLQAMTAFIVAGFFAAYLISGLIAWSNEDSVIYLRNAILTEWLTLFAIIAWVFERSIYFIANNSLKNRVNLVHINTLKEN